jgi:hypothetical protein
MQCFKSAIYTDSLNVVIGTVYSTVTDLLETQFLFTYRATCKPDMNSIGATVAPTRYEQLMTGIYEH